MKKIDSNLISHFTMVDEDGNEQAWHCDLCNDAMYVADSRLNAVRSGKSFLYINYFILNPGDEQYILMTTPSSATRVEFSPFINAEPELALVRIYKSPTITNTGTIPTSPPVLCRNLRPEKIKTPKYELRLNPTFTNSGYLVAKQVIGSTSVMAAGDFLHRFVVSEPGAVSMIRLTAVNTNTSVIGVNFFMLWYEYDCPYS